MNLKRKFMIRLLIWVTSECNLSCKWCNQAFTMKSYSHYQMSQQEVIHIVNSCERRGIRFDVIELTGGESSLWKNIEFGAKWFSTICDQVTLVTNGNNPGLIKSLGLQSWIVSESQATSEQMEQYKDVSNKVVINSHEHKKSPAIAVKGVLPADCCVKIDSYGIAQNLIEYIKGKIYYCCTAFAISQYVKLTPDLVCDFEDDFLQRFSEKKYNKEICKYCLCNTKIWNGI